MGRTLRRAAGLRALAKGGVVAAAALTIFSSRASAQADTARAPKPTPTADGDVRIPFTVGPPSCTDRERLHLVSMGIYNVLAQLVAVPVLRADSAAEPQLPPGTAGHPVTRLRLPCGRYVAYWNGRYMNTGRRLAAGVYLYELVVDERRIARKLTLGK